MGNFNKGDQVSAWLICDPLRSTPSIWKSGVIEDICYGGFYNVRLDTGELAQVDQRHVREPLGQDLMPGRIVGAKFDQVIDRVPAGTQFATIVWVNAYYAQLEIPTDGERVLVSVTLDRLMPMSAVV